MGPPAARLAEQPHGAAVGLQDVHDHADRRRLAGAVRPQETVDHALGDGERELINGGVTGEAFADPVEAQDRGREGGGGGGKGWWAGGGRGWGGGGGGGGGGGDVMRARLI